MDDQSGKIGPPVNQKVIPKGFGKGVNDYLNHYVTVSDAKAAAFLALNVVVIQFLVKDNFWISWRIYLYWAALLFLSLSIIAAASVLFPRLPCGSKGLIFWEDIRERKRPVEYEEDLSNLTADRVEQEYAHQNYYVSQVLHKKMILIRWEISLFLIGSVFAAISLAGRC